MPALPHPAAIIIPFSCERQEGFPACQVFFHFFAAEHRKKPRPLPGKALQQNIESHFIFFKSIGTVLSDSPISIESKKTLRVTGTEGFTRREIFRLLCVREVKRHVD
jgi:hypothetical protein